MLFACLTTNNILVVVAALVEISLQVLRKLEHILHGDQIDHKLDHTQVDVDPCEAVLVEGRAEHRTVRARVRYANVDEIRRAFLVRRSHQVQLLSADVLEQSVEHRDLLQIHVDILRVGFDLSERTERGDLQLDVVEVHRSVFFQLQRDLLDLERELEHDCLNAGGIVGAKLFRGRFGFFQLVFVVESTKRVD